MVQKVKVLAASLLSVHCTHTVERIGCHELSSDLHTYVKAHACMYAPRERQRQGDRETKRKTEAERQREESSGKPGQCTRSGTSRW